MSNQGESKTEHKDGLSELSYEEMMQLTPDEREAKRNGLPQQIHDLEEEIIRLTECVQKFCSNNENNGSQE